MVTNYYCQKESIIDVLKVIFGNNLSKYIVLIRNIYGFFRNVEQVFHFENDFEDEILTKFVLLILKKHTFLLFMFYLAIDLSRLNLC